VGKGGRWPGSGINHGQELSWRTTIAMTNSPASSFVLGVVSSDWDPKAPVVLESPDFKNNRDQANHHCPEEKRDDGAEEIE
jgi:hypothetical protein